MSLFNSMKPKSKAAAEGRMPTVIVQEPTLVAPVEDAAPAAPADGEVTRTVTCDDPLKSSLRLRAMIDEVADDPEDIICGPDDADPCEVDPASFVAMADDDADDCAPAVLIDDDEDPDADDENMDLLFEAWLKRKLSREPKVVECLMASDRPWFEEAPNIYRSLGWYVHNAEHPDLMCFVEMSIFVMPDGRSFTYDVNLHQRIPGRALRFMRAGKDLPFGDTVMVDPRGSSIVRFLRWRSRNNRIGEFRVVDGEVHYMTRIPVRLGLGHFEMAPDELDGYIDSTMLDCFERASEVTCLIAGVKPWLVGDEDD